MPRFRPGRSRPPDVSVTCRTVVGLAYFGNGSLFQVIFYRTTPPLPPSRAYLQGFLSRVAIDHSIGVGIGNLNWLGQ